MLDWWLPENVSTYGAEIDWLFHLIYYITGATFVLVFVTMLVFIVMYRDRPGRTARRPRTRATAPATEATAINVSSRVATMTRLKMSRPS